MTWIKVQQSLRDHRKIVALADALDIEETHALGLCVALWIWAIDNAPDGVLPTSDRAVARGAGWTGDGTRLVHGLISANLVDNLPDDRIIHDWNDHAGNLIAHRKANVKRTQEWRSRHVMHNERITNTQRTHTLQGESRVEKNRVEEKEKNPTGSKRKPTVLTADWVPSEYMLTYAKDKGMTDAQIRNAADNIRDWSLSKHEARADWDAAWRGWIRRDLERPNANGAPRQTNGKVDFYEIARRLEQEEHVGRN
jgi:hypothetical protein